MARFREVTRGATLTHGSVRAFQAVYPNLAASVLAITSP